MLGKRKAFPFWELAVLFVCSGANRYILLGREKTDSRQVHIPDNEARAMVLVGTAPSFRGVAKCYYRRMWGSKEMPKDISYIFQRSVDGSRGVHSLLNVNILYTYTPVLKDRCLHPFQDVT